MTNLLEDRFRLRFVSWVVAALFAAISLPSVILLTLLACAVAVGVSGDLEALGAWTMTILAYPSANSPAQATALVVAVLPTLVIFGCYEVDQTTSPPRRTDRLNILGRIALVGLTIGAVSTLVLLVVFWSAPDLVDKLVGDKTTTDAAKLAISGILSFQAIYAIRLLGVENVGK